MTTTNHALTGAMIATIVHQPYLAIPLAFISHFVCDALPHFGIDMKFGSRSMYTWLFLDGLAAILFAGLLLSLGVNNPLLLAISGFAAMSPDLSWFYYGVKHQLENYKKYGPISKFHSKIQWYQKVPGLIVEFAWAGLMLSLILRFQ